MLCKEESVAKDVELIMKGIYDSIGLAYHTYVTTINNQGITISEEL
jgi:homoserine kinase